jgi:hypothetical protein
VTKKWFSTWSDRHTSVLSAKSNSSPSRVRTHDHGRPVFQADLRTYKGEIPIDIKSPIFKIKGPKLKMTAFFAFLQLPLLFHGWILRSFYSILRIPLERNWYREKRRSFSASDEWTNKKLFKANSSLPGTT